MVPGYAGRVLRVDLTSGTTRVETPPELFYRTYFGGTGLVAHLVSREVPPGADPLGPENKLVFAAGGITGAPVAGSARNSVGAKSPLTGGFGSAEAGGFWPVALKAAGFDAIVLEGRAGSPVYLFVSKGRAELRDASALWGKTTGEADAILRREHGASIRVAAIGPGGENLVRYACVSNDLSHFAGRGGMGAVMGSKRLKAVVVRGGRGPAPADGEALRALSRWFAREASDNYASMTDTGTPGIVKGLNRAGGLPTLYFSEGTWDRAGAISGQALRDSLTVDRGSCFACPVRCKRVVASPGRGGIDPAYGGPEYETIAALGSLCGVDDLEAVCKANELCNAYTLDTISTGVCIAFAMECSRRGLLSAADAGGMPIRFGDPDVVLELVEMIARRRGLGDLLAEGVRLAATRIGREAEAAALHVKGQEIPMHEPRLKRALGVGYMISPTGADHVHNLHDTEFSRDDSAMAALRPFGILEPLPVPDLGPRKMRMLTYVVNWCHFLNCALLCIFPPWGPEHVVDIARAVTGWDTSLLELWKVGERSHVLARCFNLRAGIDERSEALPARFFEGFAAGPLAGRSYPRDEMDEARRTFYAMNGWDERGVPTEARLHELGIEWALTG